MVSLASVRPKRALLCLALFAACARPLPSWGPRQVTSFELKVNGEALDLQNGVRVLLMPDATAGLAAVHVRYTIGSAVEGPKEHGLAHLVEHLTFARMVGDSRVSGVLRLATVSNNAYTNEDRTHYQNLLRPESLEAVIAAEATRLVQGCAGLDEETFARERAVVINEIRQRAPARGGRYDAILRAGYGADHPYARAVGGTETEVGALTLADACRFIETHYRPANTIVVITGRFDADQARALVNKTFGAAERGPATPAAALPLVASTSAAPGQRVQVEDDLDDQRITLVWPVPSSWQPGGVEAVYLASELDTDLTVIAREKKWLTSEAGVIGGERAGLLIMTVVAPASEDAKAIEGGLRDALAWRADPRGHRRRAAGHSAAGPTERLARRLSAWSPGDWARERRFSLLSSFDDIEERAERYADAAQFGGDDLTAGVNRLAEGPSYGGTLELVDRLAATPPTVVVHRRRDGADDQGQANRKGKSNAASVSSFDGTVSDSRNDIAIDPREAHARLIAPATPKLLPLREFTLENGLHVLLQPMMTSSPIVTAKLDLDVGNAHVPPARAGLADLAVNVLAYTPAFRDPDGQVLEGDGYFATDEEQETIAVGEEAEIDIDTDVDADQSHISVRALGVDMPGVLERLGQRLLLKPHPYYINRLLATLARATRDGEDEPDPYQVFMRALYGDHAYARQTDLTEASLINLDALAVVDFMAEHYVAGNATLVIAGGFDADEYERGIRRVFGRWRAGRADRPVSVTARTGPTGPMYLGVENEGTAQITVALAYPAPAGVDGEHHARLILAKMLDLRMERIRQRLGASYGVSAGLAVRRGPAAYLAIGRVDAQRAGESLALMRAAIAELHENQGFDEDFARARRLVLARLVADSGTTAEAATNLAFLARHHLPAEFFHKLVRFVANASVEQVRGLLEAELAADKEIVLVVGDRAQIAATFKGAGIERPKLIRFELADAGRDAAK